MRRLIVMAALLVLVAAVPAGAAYRINWYSGFEPSMYQPGDLTSAVPNQLGQDGWFMADNPSYTDEVPMQVAQGAGLNGSQGVVLPNGHSAAAKDMTYLNHDRAYKAGYAKFWVYDPGYDSTLGRVDARVGVYGAKGPGNIGYMATAQIQDATTRDQNYWYAQWNYSVIKMDGVAIETATGYSFTPGLPAPRVYGAWSYVMMTWSWAWLQPGDPNSGGSGTIKWYINQLSVSPNLTLNVNSAATRWASFHDMTGLLLGSGVTSVTNRRPAAFDGFEFHSNGWTPEFEPEPSSLLALGGGMIGLLGLIRRRR